MKSRLWLISVLFSLWLPGTVLALNAEDVVRLHASGYTDAEISEVLAATQSEFLLTAREVVYLSQSGVSDAIVQNMLVALPLQPVNGDATLEAEPVRLMFTQEDLQLLAESHISDPVIVTFIETRDMAFTLDTERLTSLRQSGLGLDALQVLVEKSAEGLPVPLAPASAPAVAATGDAPAYFYGRSGNSLTSYGNSYSDSNYGSPSVFIQSRTIYPWYGYSGFTQPWYGYGFASGFTPFYVTHYPNYPYWWSGYRGHTFFCPRGPHHHGGGGHHNGGNTYADNNHGNSTVGVFYGTGTKPGGTKPGVGTGHYNGGKPYGSGTNGNSIAGVYFGSGTKPGTGTGLVNGSHSPVVQVGGISHSSGTRQVVSRGSTGGNQGANNSGGTGPAPAAIESTFAPRGGSAFSIAGAQPNIVAQRDNGPAPTVSIRVPDRVQSTSSSASQFKAGNETPPDSGLGRRERPR